MTLNQMRRSEVRLLSMLATFAASACQAEQVAVPFHEVDQQYVQLALDVYSGHGKIPPDKVAARVYPVVVHMPDMTCVGLNLRPGMAGGDTTICFDDKTHVMRFHYVNGQ